MKTILIPIFQGVEARNILRTDIYRVLQARKDARIVLLVSSEEKRRHFSKEFCGDNVTYELFEKYKMPRFGKFFSFLKFVLLNTATMDFRRRIDFWDERRYFSYYFQMFLSRVFASHFWRRIVRFLDWHLVKDDNFKDIFDRYRPDLVFLGHVFGDEESAILREARHRVVPSVALINSWDKLTSRSMIRLLPDLMIVHNEIMKREAMAHADMSEEKIRIVGIPHYDDFVNLKPRPKEEFCRIVGADPRKRILMFCPLGKRYYNTDPEILEMILSLQKEGKIPGDLQVMVRFPPNDIVEIDLGHKNEVIFVQPGIRFTEGKERRMDWDMGSEDIQLLVDALHCVSLVVCYVSSISVDAAVFNKPIVHFRKTTGPDARAFELSYSLTHYQPILASGGVRVTHTREEFAEWINNYLKNPNLDSEGRKKIVEGQCWKLDGKSGERTAKIILEMLN